MKTLLQSLLLAATVSFGGLAQADAVDINSADAQTLADNLSGVGLAKAEAIVQYRDANGPFAAIEDLDKVKGIGAKIIESNRASLQLTSDTQAASKAN